MLPERFAIRISYPAWSSVAEPERSAFVRVIRPFPIDELVVNGRPYLRQTRLRRLLGRPPALV